MSEDIEFNWPNRKDWHLDKTVSLTHLFSTIAAIAALVVLGSQFNTRLAVVEQAIIEQHSRDAQQDADHLEFKKSMATAIQNINDKLDRIIERERK